MIWRLHRLKTRVFGSHLITVAGTIFNRGLSSFLQFALNIVLGRVLGPAGIGLYYIYLSWTNLLGTIGGVGLSTYTLRTTAAFTATGKGVYARRSWRRHFLVVLAVASSLALLLYSLRSRLAVIFLGDNRLGYLVGAAAFSAIPFALLALSSATIKALKRPGLGLVFEFAFVPMLMLAYAGYFYVQAIPLRVSNIILINLIGIILSLFGAVVSAENVFVHSILKGTSATEECIYLQGSVSQVLHYWLLGVMGLVKSSIPFMLLPLLGSQEQVGLFGVANRLVSLAIPILLAISSVYSPLFASAFARKEVAALRSLLQQTRLYSVGTYAPLLFLFLMQSDSVLRLFGDQFIVAKPHLMVLALGQFVNSVTGLVTFFNLMTGNERFEAMVNAATLVITIVLSLLLADFYDALGVTIAVAFSTALKNILSLIKAQNVLKVLEGSYGLGES